MPNEHRSYFIDSVESSFDCRLPANFDDAGTTLGDVHDYVVSSLGFSSGGSVGMHVFNTVRRALIEGAGLRRIDVKPDANLDELMPLKIRRSMWSGFLTRLPWDSSNLYLRYPQRIAKPAGALALGCFVAIWIVGGVLAALHIFSILYMLPVLLFSAGVIYFLWKEPQNPLATDIPDIFNTPRKLTHYLRDSNYGKIAKQIHMWNETEVWALIEELAKKYAPEDQPLSRETVIADFYDD
jgi:hypothetical protein